MKNITLAFLSFVLSTVIAMGQETVLKELTSFDKVIIKGNVDEIKLRSSNSDSPVVKVAGVDEEWVTAEVTAGTLNLTIEADKNSAVEVGIYNGRLRRISAREGVKITGAEVIGGEFGNYLVVDFHGFHMGGASWAAGRHDFDVHIPEIDIDLPEIDFSMQLPGFDFDIDHDFHFDETFQYNWEDHKEEIRRWSEEWGDEMKEAVKEAQEEMKKAREEMKRAKEELKKKKKE